MLIQLGRWVGVGALRWAAIPAVMVVNDKVHLDRLLAHRVANIHSCSRLAIFLSHQTWMSLDCGRKPQPPGENPQRLCCASIYRILFHIDSGVLAKNNNHTQPYTFTDKHIYSGARQTTRPNEWVSSNTIKWMTVNNAVGYWILLR